MDTGSLSFPYEEHFASFRSSDFLSPDDDSRIDEPFGDVTSQSDWNWHIETEETELNGDVALIPTSSEVVGMDYLSKSPPIREDFQKMMSEWQHLMNIEVPAMEGVPPFSADDDDNIMYIADTTPNPIVESFLNVPLDKQQPFSSLHPAPSTSQRIVKSVGKKINMHEQCYIVNDNETVKPKVEIIDSEDEEHDGEEVNNFNCASEDIIDIVKHEVEDLMPEQPDIHGIPSLDNNENLENEFIDVDTISNSGIPILQAGDLNSLLEQFEATEAIPCPPSNEHLLQTTQPIQPTLPPTSCENPLSLQVTVQVNPTKEQNEFIPSLETETNKNSNKQGEQINLKTDVPNNVNNNKSDEPEDKRKQILDALPQELIKRIKASSKRKIVTVIDPIPNKRRGIRRLHTVETPVTPQEKIVEKSINPPNTSIQLDHDYCSQSTTPYPKHPKKDSGFESAEEDEQRNILRNQPTVKGADGKLMVSLLKVNTIRNAVSEADKKKRKLNLEEYKKRREGFARSCDNSQNSSPVTSGRNSPAVVEDENQRLLKHQQKLMQMAAEVLKTPPKNAQKPVAPVAAPEKPKLPPPSSPEAFAPPPPPPRILPNNVEVRVLVSIGVNTDVSQTVSSPINNVPVKELEEIKPLLRSANTKISNNSLITSVIENLKNKTKTQSATFVQNKSNEQPVQLPHGEDKTIVYLDKDRPTVVSKNVEVQTEVIKETEVRRHNRRHGSSSSTEHRKRRSSSNDSRCSYSSSHSSSYSSSSRSRSRSRSSSPHRIYSRKRYSDVNQERIREVEERRIIYVGGISSTTDKESLHRRFRQYGPITNVSVHYREYGDNYGFVTFADKRDAYNAVEHGNDDPNLPAYELSFGGRRIFCRTSYADLDNVQDDLSYPASAFENSFDSLLQKAKADLYKRRTCT